MRVSGCIGLIADFDARDAEALDTRLRGLSPDPSVRRAASIEAVRDTLGDVERARREFLDAVRAQHPDAFARWAGGTLGTLTRRSARAYLRALKTGNTPTALASDPVLAFLKASGGATFQTVDDVLRAAAGYRSGGTHAGVSVADGGAVEGRDPATAAGDGGGQAAGQPVDGGEGPVEVAPKLGARAEQALGVLRAGGYFRKALETQWRGGEQFKTRLYDARRKVVSGFGFRTQQELMGLGYLKSREVAHSSAYPEEWVYRDPAEQTRAAMDGVPEGAASAPADQLVGADTSVDPVPETSAGRSDQFERYRRFIADNPGEITAGLAEQIRGDERLNDGEGERLLASIGARDRARQEAQTGRPGTDLVARGPKPVAVPTQGVAFAVRQLQRRALRAEAEREVFSWTLAQTEIANQALAVVRDGESQRGALRIEIERAIGRWVGAEMGRRVRESADQDLALQALDGLVADGKPSPVVFDEATLKAWEDEAIRRAMRVERAARKAAHRDAIAAALEQAWNDWRAQAQGAKGDIQRNELMRGWAHAIDGGTASSLPPPPADMASYGIGANDKTARDGYEAAVAWLGSDAGKAFATGAKRKKMAGVGEPLRRAQDERARRLEEIALGTDADADAFVDAILAETQRAELFPAETPDGATPGTARYLADLRNAILPFKEWMAAQGYGGRRKYEQAPEEALRRSAREGQGRREAIQAAAQWYAQQVSGLAEVMQGHSSIEKAEVALARWYYKDIADKTSDELSAAAALLVRGDYGDSANRQPFRGLMRPGRIGALSQFLVSNTNRRETGWKLRDHLRAENDALAADKSKPLTRPLFDRVEREGPDYRQGRNISANELATTFGLKGVTYGESVTAVQRQDHTNYAYDAFMDLAKLLGIDPQHIGMGGRIAFAFGALGRGTHSAHYQHGTDGQAINLTSTRGDGSVAHEWLHALDWNLRSTPGFGGAGAQEGPVREMVAVLRYTVPSQERIEKGLDRFLSGAATWSRQGRGATPIDHGRLFLNRTIRDLQRLVDGKDSIDRWAGVGSTQFDRDAQALGKDYWGNPAEEFARAGESWVYDALEGRNNYLVSDWVEDGKVTAATHRGRPYPTGDERAVFADAWPRFFEQVEWTAQGPRAKGLAPRYQVLRYPGERVMATTPDRKTAEAWIEANRDGTIYRIVETAAAEHWESPLRAKARDGIETARTLLGELDRRYAAAQQVQEDKARAAREAQERDAKARAEAEEKAREEQSAKIRAEWEAMQQEKAPGPAPGPQPRTDAQWDALLDEAEAELAEESQEPEREKDREDQDATRGGTDGTEPAFVDDPNRPVIALARTLAARDWSTKLTWRELGRLADAAFGGTKAEGKYSPKDAYDALEMALNLVLRGPGKAYSAILKVGMDGKTDALAGLNAIEALDNAIPTQTNRTAEQDELQQFSTPHTHAALMARVANLSDQDVVLEPSAGSGNLATVAQALGAQAVAVNELAPRRAAILKALGFDAVTSENAEHIASILGPKGLKPTVVMMNPPFSATAGRMAGVRDNRVGAKHVEEALKLLAPGGRAVILMGQGYTRGHRNLSKHWAWVLKQYNVRANIGLDGSQYKKFGTTFDNRLVVIDKTGPTANPDAILGGERQTVAQALEMLEGVRNDRVHVGERYGAESEGGGVAEAGRIATVGVSPVAPAGPLGDVQSESPGSVEAGEGGDARAPVAPGAKGGGKPGARGQRAGGGRGAGRRATTTTTGAGSRVGGGSGAGAALQPGGPADPGLAELAKGAAQHGLNGVGEALHGLFELFGGNRVKSFPAGFDAETYAKAKPHFEAAAREFLAAGNDFKAFFKFLLKYFGAGIRPYAKQYAKEYEARALGHEALEDTAPPLSPEPAPGAADPSANVPPEPPPETPATQRELTDAIYDGYSPSPIWADLGAQPHPSELVESSAMAAVDLPALTARPDFPPEVYREGRLSSAQLDAVAYTQQAHERILPSGERQGFFIGDGTGVGKGREIAGIVWNNWRQGRKKAVWISVNNDLAVDSRTYLKAVADDELGLFELSKTKADAELKATEGVLFASYAMLRSAGRGERDATGAKVREGQRRVDQIVAWLGADFDGVIAFDESHNMGNALVQKAERGSTKPSAQALAGLELQRRLPKARVVYVSATGATEVSNLGYVSRLGLWGEGTPFADTAAFVANVASGGVAAMEVVAKDMKAMGVYMARSLPFREVTYAQMEHPLTQDQTEMYDAIAGAWQIVLRDVTAALGSEQTNAGKSGDAKSAAMTAFWGSQQRFFNQMLTALQMPTLVRALEEDLAAGRAPVLQIVNTNEAATKRVAAKLADEGRDLEELDITPRQVLLQYLHNSFPVHQFEEYTDDDGNKKARLVKDSAGNPVQNLEAVAARDALIDRVAQLRFPDNPLDIVVNRFGPDKVAEITGRSRRYIKDPETGKVREEKRSDKQREKEVDEFQGDARQILIFSDKGGTGKSYHADKTARNQRKRVHYVVQPGWRADKAIQGLGRTHRTNQAQAPHVVLVTTDLRGHRRFVASIARRMDQLGALTKGQRQTGGQGLFTEDMNLESWMSDQALEVLIRDVLAGRVEGVGRDTLSDKMGFETETKEGNRRGSGQPTIQQFLNRILVLEAGEQSRLFDAFSERLRAQTESAAAAGTLDRGLENIKAAKLVKTSDEEVYAHPRTGAKTRMVALALTDPVDLWTFDGFMEETLARRTPPFFARNRASGRVYGFTIGADRTMKDGSVVKTYRRWSVKARLSASDSQAEIGYPDKPDHWQTREAFKKWEYLDLPAARAAWAEDFATRPKEETHTVNLLTGVLLPIWDRLKDLPTVRVQRALTDDGEMVLGRLIPAAQVDTVLSRLTGSSRAAKLSPRQLFDAVLKDGATVILANNWRLVPRRVSGQMRIELTGPREQAEIRMIQSQGVMYERIGYEPRYFVPTDPEAGSAVLERVTANRPAVELVAGKGAAAEGADPGVRFHLAYHGSPHDFTRQRTPAGTGEVLSAAFMQARADATAKAWKGLAGIAVRAVQRERDLPAPALDELARVRASNPGAFPKAVWVPGAGPDGRGKIVLVADNLRDVRDGLTRLVHEAVGHVGVQAVFGPRLASFLDELIETRSADVALYARQYGLDMERLADRRVAAEELLAHMAEINAEADRPFLERVYQAIRAALRALGVRLRLSDGDLREILAAAGRYVREGDARGALAVRSRFAPKPGGARPGGGRFMVSGPNPSDPILIDSGVVWGEITPAIAREAKQQTRQSLVAAPIRLLGGVHLGKHRGYGLAHVEAEHGDEIRALGMSVEEFIAQAIAEASQIWADGRRLVLARTGRRKTASVIELMQGDGYYSVVTAFPVTKQFKTFGDLAWRGRKLAGITQNQAPGLDSQGSPLVDRQLTNPPEPLSGNDVLHPPLEALRGQPDDSRIDAGDGEDKPDGGPRFSLDSSRLDGGLPTGAQALDDAADSAWAKLKETIGNQAARLLPASLQSLTLRQLAEVGAKILPGIERYDALRRQMESARNGMMEEAGEFAQEVFGAWVYGGKDRPLMQYLRPKVSAEARALFDLIHQATLANVDPAEAHKPLSFTMALGPGWPDQRIEVSEASLEDLKERIERWKGSDENRNRAPYAIAALKQVERLMPAERKRRAARPALVQAWNALSQGRVHDADGAGWDSKDAAHKAKTEIDKTERRPTLVKRRTDGRWIVQAYGAQEIYREARDLYKDRDRQRFEALLARIKDDTALDPAAKEKEIARMRADFESSVTRNGKIKVEPYFPLYRTGQYYVAGRLYVDAAPAPAEFYKDDVAQTPYKTDEAAWSASRKRAELARYNLVPVKLDDDSGWILREVGEPFFGRYATPGEAKAAAAELANEGYAQIRQGMVKKSEREVEGVTEGFIADAVTKLTAAGDTEAADLLHQMYLAQLNELSQRTHFIHRKGIAGYEDSALAAFGHTMFHLSHQIAKLQYGPRLAEQVRVIEENKAERADAVRADAFLGELKERHGWVMNPDNAPWTNVTAALGFFWYLGVSPAAALVNLTQTPIIAYPILAARFNDWRGAGRAMRDAFADVRCGMGADQLKGYLQGKPHPALPANLSAQEKAAFEAWTLSGGRDVTQAHNLAGIGDSDRWNNSPAATRAMGILSSGFHLAEVVNRDVTLLAAYRLARAKGMRHKAAVELADKLTTDSHLDYGNANRARFMQSNTAKALLMFKSYSQGIVYLLGRSVWQATAGESAEVKREARQRLTGILGMTFLASGAAGLPLLGSGFAILNLVAAAFGDDDEPWDAETEFRSFLTRNLPGPFAAVIDRGAVNALTGLDISSRVGLSTLVFREPERDLDGAGTYQYMIEQILGPLGGIASSPFTAYDHLREGHVNRALEAMTPKFVRDALKAGRYATEGVRTRRGDPVLGEDGSVNPWETVWQALGFSPDRVSAAWDTTNMLKLYEGRIVDRRTALQTALALATIDGDAEAQAAVLPKIRAWNQHWAESPKLLITPRTVRASVRGRERYSERARSGVALNPGVEGLRERVGAP